MDKLFVTETPDELLDKAEKDILNIKALLSQKFYPEDIMYDIICFHATMAVEKILKSYIIINGKNVEKTHDLSYLCKSAMEIDTSFKNISDDCASLNDFVPGRKYGDEVQISKKDMDNIVKSLDNICDFPPIKSKRDSFNEKHHYRIIDETSEG